MLNDLYNAIDPVAFTIGPVSVRWYGIAYVLGFFAVALIMYTTARRWKLRFDVDALLTILLCGMLGVILGARIGYVIVYGGSYYAAHPNEIFYFWNGGMSFHGGLAGAAIALFIAAKITKIPLGTLGDLAVIGAPLGLFFGRCANFINGELWGAPTNLPWGVVFGGSAGTIPRHPSQLYEALLEGIVIFIVLYALSRRRPVKPQGTFLGLFLVMYGCFRFLIEFVRQPDAQIGYLAGDWFTMGMLLSLPVLLVGIALLVWAHKARRPQQGLPQLEKH